MKTYEQRVRAYEAEGMTRSDAQGIVDLEDRRASKAIQQAPTPGPWTTRKIEQPHPEHGNYWIERHHAPERSVDSFTALATIYDEANAAFIVRACNAHKELVKALEKARAALYNVPEVGQKYNQQHSHTHAQACLDIESALALARGQEQP